jgi:DNA-binding LacI/PurR family transcriptional regulator
MPGRHEVAAELGVSPQTAQAALAMLEREGLLVSQGSGRPRRIERQMVEASGLPLLRVAILVAEAADRQTDYMVDLKHQLIKAGHAAFFTPWLIPDYGMNVASITSYLRRTEADAWIVAAGARPLLEWFVEEEVPVFAIFGRLTGLPLAGAISDKGSAIAQATQRLIQLGHRRVVFLTRRALRIPHRAPILQTFLDELAAHGIPTGEFNLPDWEEDLDGFHRLLNNLFQHTPPTALIVDESIFLVATMQFLQSRRLQVPEDISLICTDGDPHFTWCRPSIAHIQWDTAPVVRRALRWADNVARGKQDTRQKVVNAEFFEGGTIGPAPGK